MSSMTANRQYELVASRRGRVTSTEVPAPGAGQVLVQVHANGLCASDLSQWRDGQGTIGHEPVGTAVEIGAGVELTPGSSVTGRFVGSYTDFVLAEPADIVPLPTGVPQDLALGEPLGCVAEALRRAPVRLGERVVIIGLGFMGLCMAQLLACTPAARLTGIDLRDDARATAVEIGVVDAYSPTGLPAGLSDVDLVIEASGSQAGLDLATELVRPHGRISVLGYHQGTRQVDLQAWNWKAIDVINAHVRDRSLLRTSIAAGLDMIAAGRIDLTRLVTHRFPLERTDDAFTLLEKKPPGFVKAVIELS